MVRETKVNYGRLLNLGMAFTENAKELNSIINRIKELDEQLKTVWQGEDCDKFILSNMIVEEKLFNKAEYLEGWGQYLSRSSRRYNDTVVENTQSINHLNNIFLEDVKGEKFNGI